MSRATGKLRIAFLDCCNREPYDDGSLDEGIGGAEATVIRVSRALASRGHEVFVWQHNRPPEQGNGRFVGKVPDNVDHAIVLREPWLLPQASQLLPRATIHLWSHDSQNPYAWHEFAPVIEMVNPRIIAPSQFQRTTLLEGFGVIAPSWKPIVTTLFNPIDDDLKPEPDHFILKNRLLFCSHPERGLDRAITLLQHAIERIPRLHLVFCHPSYVPPVTLRLPPQLEPHISYAGAMAHRDVIAGMRSSLCVFYPNTVVAEAFGLVYAEANAVGTPVLSHRLGAAPEVLSPPSEQIVNCFDPAAVTAKLVAWQEKRPAVGTDIDKFRISNVALEWEHYLFSSMA